MFPIKKESTKTGTRNMHMQKTCTCKKTTKTGTCRNEENIPSPCVSAILCSSLKSSLREPHDLDAASLYGPQSTLSFVLLRPQHGLLVVLDKACVDEIGARAGDATGGAEGHVWLRTNSQSTIEGPGCGTCGAFKACARDCVMVTVFACAVPLPQSDDKIRLDGVLSR